MCRVPQRGAHAHPTAHKAGSHVADPGTDSVQVLVVPLELKVGCDSITRVHDGVAASVVHRRKEQTHRPAAQCGRAQPIVRDLLEVILPHVISCRGIVVLVLADLARIRRCDHLPAKEDKRRQASTAREVELVEHTLNLAKEAVVVVIGHDQQDVNRRRGGTAGRGRRRQRHRRTLQHAPFRSSKRVARAGGALPPHMSHAVAVTHGCIRKVNRSREDLTQPRPARDVVLAHGACRTCVRLPKQPTHIVPGADLSLVRDGERLTLLDARVDWEPLAEGGREK
eukprot:scaffold72783_cov69-Phaeocystis_antarctica.AAC.2